MRKFFTAIILLLGFVFIVAGLAELETLANTIRHGNWLFLFLAIVAQFAWIGVVAYSFQTIYRIIGVSENLLGISPLVLSANFVNVVAPSGGVSGISMFVLRARQKGYSTARAMVSGALFVEFDYFGFLCLLSLGLFVLFRRNTLTAVEIAASAIFILVALVLFILLFLGMQSSQALGRALTLMARAINKSLRPLINRDYFSEERALTFAHDAAEGLTELKSKPKKMLFPALLAILNKSLLVLILLLVFLAFNVPVAPGTIVAGFSIGYLFLIVSPTPAGIGFVEGSLTLALSGMYIPLEAAALITLVYRGITFWLPFFIGMAAFRWMGTQPIIEEVE